MHSKVDWNDHISEFVRLKVEQPQVIAELLTRTHTHKQIKLSHRRVEQLEGRCREGEQRLGGERMVLEREEGKRAAMLREVGLLVCEIERTQEEIDKQSQLSIRMEPDHSRSDFLPLDSPDQNETDLTALQTHYAHQKAEIRSQLTQLVADKVQLKEQIERQLAALAETRRKSATAAEYAQTRERVQKWKAKVGEEEERCGQLQEQFKRWMSENEKPQKRQRMEHEVLEESRKRLREGVKQLKKFIQNSHMRAGKKYEELMSKMEGYRSEPHVLEQRFQQLQAQTVKVPLVVSSARVGYEQWVQSVAKVVDVQPLNEHELAETILEQSGRRNRSSQQAEEFDKGFAALESYLVQLQRREEGIDHELSSLRSNLERKNRDIANEQQRIKHNKA